MCGLQVVFMACVAFKLFSWHLPLSSEHISSITHFQTCFYNVYCPHFLIVYCVGHWHLLLLYKFYSVCHAPLFRTIFSWFVASLVLCDVMLVLYLTYTFHLYFAFCVFSVSMLFRISCSLLVFHPYELLVIFSFLQLVMV